MLASFALSLSLFMPPAQAAPAFVHRAYASCEPFFTRVSELSDRHLAVDSKPWTIDPKVDASIQTLFADPSGSDEVRMRESVRLIMTDRAEQTGRRLRGYVFRHAIASGLNPTTLYQRTLGKLISRLAGPHQLFMTPFISMAPVAPANPAYGIIAIHELTHAYDQVFHIAKSMIAYATRFYNLGRLVLRNPVAPYLHNRMERSAIGAQWELVHRIPAEARARLIAQIEDARFARPIAPEREAAYRRLIDTNALGLMDQIIKALHDDGLIPARVIEIEQFVIGRQGQKRSALRAYRSRLLDLTAADNGVASADRARARELVGADRLAFVRMLLIDPTVLAAPAEPVAWGEAHQAAFDKLCRAHRRAHRSSAEAGLDALAIESLKAAEMDKASFIEYLEPLHGYDLKSLMHDEFLGFGRWRKLLVTQAAWVMMTGGTIFMAKDVQWVFDHLAPLLRTGT